MAVIAFWTLSAIVLASALFVIMAPRPLALRRAVLPEHPADPALGQSQLRPDMVDAGAATRGA